MPRSRSAAPPRSLPISAATPIASLSPTAASWPATSTTSPSPGKTTAATPQPPSPGKNTRPTAAAMTMRLTPGEFIRRFLLHTLPDGFHRIRHFGFLANGHRAAKLALARALPTRETEPDDTAASAAAPESAHQATLDRGAATCPICGGIVRVTSYLPAGCGRLATAAAIFRCDTS